MADENGFDVVVVGSGSAGLAAAICAAETGASVLVAEAEPLVGGTSRISTGMLLGAGTALQAANGIEDDPADLYREYMQTNQWRVNPGLAHKLAYESGPAIDWLGALGVTFHPSPSYAGEENKPRNHLPVGLGYEVIDVLQARAKQLHVDFALGQRVNKLLVDDATGAVCGVAVGDDELRAKAVVVATGGFGASVEKMSQHFDRPATVGGDWMWYMGADGARGDAFDLAEQVGAQIAGEGRGLCFLTPNFTKEYEATLPGWLVLLNADGRRFCDETVAYGLLDRLVAQQGGRAFVIFDESARVAAPIGKPAQYRQSNPSMPGRKSPNWNDETIEAMAASGRVARENTVADVANALGLPPEQTAATIARYNESVRHGRDGDFRKASEFLREVSTAPFYGAELRTATVALTSCGLAIDDAGQVLAENGTTIDGLYAAGECTGGVLGDVYVGSGNSWSNCIVFGRAAGRAAGSYAVGLREGQVK